MYAKIIHSTIGLKGVTKGTSRTMCHDLGVHHQPEHDKCRQRGCAGTDQNEQGWGAGAKTAGDFLQLLDLFLFQTIQ